MGRFSVKGRFSGREGWRTANFVIGFGLYFVVIVLLLEFPQYLWILGIFMVIFLPSYGYVSERTKRIRAENSKGVRCVEGYTTFAHKKAEVHIFEPVNFEIKEQLSPAVLADIQNYINIQKEHTEYLRTRTGLEGFKQLSYYKETNVDESNNIEKLKSDKIEKENYEKSKEEYIKIMIKKKELKTKTNENEEVNDE